MDQQVAYEQATDQQVADEQATDSRPAEGRSGGRRYRSGRQPPPRQAAEPWSPPAATRPGAELAPFPDRMALAGMLAGLLVVFLASCLFGAWLHLYAVAGLGFCAGTCVAAGYARREALLAIVVSVPAIFLAAEVVTQLATAPTGAHRGTPVLVLEGTLLALARVAPWLVGGSIVGVVIAMFRGLPQSVGHLRADLSGGRRVRNRKPAPRGRPAS